MVLIYRFKETWDFLEFGHYQHQLLNFYNDSQILIAERFFRANSKDNIIWVQDRPKIIDSGSIPIILYRKQNIP